VKYPFNNTQTQKAFKYLNTQHYVTVLLRSVLPVLVVIMLMTCEYCLKCLVFAILLSICFTLILQNIQKLTSVCYVHILMEEVGAT